MKSKILPKLIRLNQNIYIKNISINHIMNVCGIVIIDLIEDIKYTGKNSKIKSLKDIYD
jgi:hypothetical protein